MSSGEIGHLVGGPHDGIEFSTARNFWLARPDQLPEPAQRVYATVDGQLEFWFTSSVIAPPHFGPRPPLSRYDLCPDDDGWVYRYVGEEQHD